MLKVRLFVFISLWSTLSLTSVESYYADRSKEPNAYGKYLAEAIDPERIKSNLEELTKHPHLAGSDANSAVANVIQRLWNEAGLENVHTTEYEVLLSYPNYDNPNTVAMEDKAGNLLFKTTGISPPIIKSEQSDPKAGIQWLAYSAPGIVSADVVYVNRGKPEDFDKLEQMGISVKDKIALMRFGECFRGNKVQNAQQRGAAGVLLFDDPSDVAPNGYSDDLVYPHTLYMPSQDVQRGTLTTKDGDPLTPLYPAKPTIFKTRTIEQAKKEGILPNIPALPISYDTAFKIISRMAGESVPSDWQGLLHVTYKFGPGFTNGEKLTMEVRSSLETRIIRNIIGYIRGSLEPDRYVMLGNHYDAWVYGSLDPNSGTAIMAEMARAMMQTIKETGWRPARSIVFNNWDAEEFSLIGSTEFVEEFAEILDKRAVVYINMDCLKFNESIAVKATPDLYQIVVEAAKAIPNFNEAAKQRGETTIYDTFLRNFPRSDEIFPGVPFMKVPDGGSDMAPFLNYAGVPVIDFSVVNQTLAKSTDDYPLYHTLYETAFANEHLVDIDHFKMHRGVGQLWAELVRRFADDVILPLNHTMFAEAILQLYITDVEKTINNNLTLSDSDAIPIKEQLKYLRQKAEDFLKATHEFDQSKRDAQEKFTKNPSGLRMSSGVNERLMGVSRSFINPRGIPGAAYSRHVLYSVSEKNQYAGSVMTAVYDAIDAYKKAESRKEKMEAANEIAEQLSIVQHSINSAIMTLKDMI